MEHNIMKNVVSGGPVRAMAFPRPVSALRIQHSSLPHNWSIATHGPFPPVTPTSSGKLLRQWASTPGDSRAKQPCYPPPSFRPLITGFIFNRPGPKTEG
jgi:hypothetical protein